MKPSEQITKALSGELDLSKVDAASLSNMRLQIYKIACGVLSERNNTKRKEIIETYPEGIQTLIRNECRRVYDLRR